MHRRGIIFQMKIWLETVFAHASEAIAMECCVCNERWEWFTWIYWQRANCQWFRVYQSKKSVIYCCLSVFDYVFWRNFQSSCTRPYLDSWICARIRESVHESVNDSGDSNLHALGLGVANPSSQSERGDKKRASVLLFQQRSAKGNLECWFNGIGIGSLSLAWPVNACMVCVLCTAVLKTCLRNLEYHITYQYHTIETM